jgi:integrase
MASSPQGALVVRTYKKTPYYEAKWRDPDGIQLKKRLGKAWLDRGADGGWMPRRGRVRPGYLDERRAYLEMARVIEEIEEKRSRTTPKQREATFDDAATAWLEYVQYEKRIKPTTLARYQSMLRQPDKAKLPRTPKSGRNQPRSARIMREFGGRKLADVSVGDVRRWLSMLDREDISARTVNVYRQVLHAIFEYAKREDSFGLRENPVAGTVKRPEEGDRPVETFEPEEVWAIAEAARSSLHRTRPQYGYSEETNDEWQRINDQDAAFYVVAACTGMRLGELCALRWADVDLKGGFIVVSRAMSAGQELSTKSRRMRPVPIAEQAGIELKRLARREHFTARTDFVFCRPDGGSLDRTAVRKRFIKAQEEAGVRVRRFHDLRHTFGSLAIREFDLVAIKNMMGHAKLSTTERYLHTKPRPDDATKLTDIFKGRTKQDNDDTPSA